MNMILIFIKRNLKLFVRDRATVFFSLLSTLILIMLYFLFIAKVYTSGMDDPNAGGIATALSGNAKNFIVYLQMMAGVMVLNSMSLATGAFSTIAKDFESKRIDSFMLTPIKTREMIFSYFSTGFAASFGINTLTWIISYIIIDATTGYWLAAGAFLMVLVVLLVASLISCSLMLLVTALVKSSSAIGVVNGISGTFFGFLCGIYMPYGNLGEGTKVIGSLLPFSHLTIWLKRVVLDNAFAQVGIDGEFKTILYRDYFSAESIGFCALSAPLWLMVFLSGVFAVLCLAASCSILNKRLKRQ